MAYAKKTWVSGETPLSAENMNNIENGIADAHEDISKLNTKRKWTYLGKVTGLDSPLSVAGLSDVQEFRCLIRFPGTSTGTELVKIMDIMYGNAGTYMEGYKFDSTYYAALAVQYSTGYNTLLVNSAWTKVFGGNIVAQDNLVMHVWYR